MRRSSLAVSFLLGSLVVVSGGCGTDEAPAAETKSPAAAAPAGPSAGDREYARLTASWSQAALDGCAVQLRDALGTRDLVQGALDGVSDPAGKAKAEVEDARSWIQKGDEKFAEVKPRLEQGDCDGTVTTALDEAWQLYVKAGTSAVQAGQIAGSQGTAGNG